MDLTRRSGSQGSVNDHEAAVFLEQGKQVESPCSPIQEFRMSWHGPFLHVFHGPYPNAFISHEDVAQSQDQGSSGFLLMAFQHITQNSKSGPALLFCPIKKQEKVVRAINYCHKLRQ
jgi:hypothetical protein